MFLIYRRRKREEGRRKKEKGRGKKEEGGRRKEEGRRRREEGRTQPPISLSLFLPIPLSLSLPSFLTDTGIKILLLSLLIIT
jgi:hypothetical protein